MLLFFLFYNKVISQIYKLKKKNQIREMNGDSNQRNFSVMIITDKISTHIERLIHGRLILNFSVDLMSSGLSSEGLHAAVCFGLFDPYLPLTPSPQLLESLKKPLASKSLSLLDSWIHAATIDADHHLCGNVMHSPIYDSKDVVNPSKDFVSVRHQFLVNLSEIISKQNDVLTFQKYFIRAWCNACSSQYFEFDTCGLLSTGLDKQSADSLKSLNGFLANTISNYSLFPAKSFTDTLTLLIEQPSTACPKEEVLWSLRGDLGKTSHSVPESVIVKRVQERRKNCGESEIPKKQIEEALRNLVGYKVCSNFNMKKKKKKKKKHLFFQSQQLKTTTDPS